ncbi:MAG: ABC transporter permease, partial [Pseudomonas sp.]
MSRAEPGTSALYHRVVVYVLFIILLLPLAGTLL